VRLIDQAVIGCGICAALAIGVCGALSDSQSDAYQAIVLRNAFGLKDPPPPLTNQIQPPNVVTNVKFTGISTYGGKKALLIIPDPDKPRTPNAFIYPILREGESMGGVEVVSINEEENSVKIISGGITSELNFKDNGNNAAPPTVAAAAGQPGAPGGAMPVGAGGVPQPTPIARPANFIPPGRVQGSTPATDPNSNLRQIPTRPLRVGQQSTGVPDQAGLVQSMLNVEITREANKGLIATGQFPPLPPTELTEPGPGGP
jgi:hypothetical protein